ncbi:hypothetical protein [Kiloniella sp. b19]|uniref:hypothetical protein n=1 Tax=Kiloniella sp. GXU_MW_B19 TaxID=3141326 RepID=UPI0031DAB432
MTALQTPISAYFALAFAILFLLVGGLVSYIYIGSSANTRSLKANGVATEATITEQFLISREKTPSDKDYRKDIQDLENPADKFFFYIRYSFRLPNGEIITSDYRLDAEEDYADFQIDDIIDIVYDSTNPESTYVSEIGLRENNPQLPYFLMGLLSCGLALLWLFFRLKV